MLNKLLIVLLLTGCVSEPIVPKEPEKPKLELPIKPSFDCTEIKWYYINEKLALDVADFKLLLKCEVTNKQYTKNLEKQIKYYRGDL